MWAIWTVPFLFNSYFLPQRFFPCFSICTSSLNKSLKFTLVFFLVSEEFGAPTDDSLESQLTKQSCHDSGIDIRDPAALPLPTVKKAVYSDADILLSSDNDFVPPIPVIPDHDFSRKKTNSVSFSLEDNKENTESNKTDETDKHQESKKNKVYQYLNFSPISNPLKETYCNFIISICYNWNSS